MGCAHGGGADADGATLLPLLLHIVRVARGHAAVVRILLWAGACWSAVTLRGHRSHTAGNCLMRMGGGERPMFTCLKRRLRWRRLRWGGWRLWNPPLSSTPVSTPPCAHFKP
ncbi:hypothetical protein EON67_07140 [archaeon]|nr:MAG: hypothetical protein EON67_07140 [archaeon]